MLLLGVVMENLVVIIVGMKHKHPHKHTTYQHDHHGKAKKLAISQMFHHPPEMSHCDWWNSTLKRKAFDLASMSAFVAIRYELIMQFPGTGRFMESKVCSGSSANSGN